ncbi:unnamed protein product [Urochloa decumbens]|uniref:Bifunctional inhibitor/plant lipid transfer protein/seed storage helical domain-containing protein n=1 Tax=Urochloa decumbens TaxID=240449 RepID=A0ABC8VUC2_9POAL
MTARRGLEHASGRRFAKPEPSTTSPSPRLRRLCWMSLVLLTALSSASGAYAAKNIPRSEEGTCRFDLTSVAAFSCASSPPPSQSCCNALLHAIDQVPGSQVSGACCLCRYLKEKEDPVALATAYVMCNGKDKHIVAEWSLLSAIKRCSAECTRRSTSTADMGTSTSEDSPVVGAEDTPVVRTEESPVVPVHGNRKGIWIAVAAVIVMGAICFWYFRRFKAATSLTAQRRTSSQEAEPRAGRRRSVAPSSPAKLK